MRLVLPLARRRVRALTDFRRARTTRSSVDIPFSEGPVNLNWQAIMKTVNDDPYDFFKEGGWGFLMEDEAVRPFPPSSDDHFAGRRVLTLTSFTCVLARRRPARRTVPSQAPSSPPRPTRPRSRRTDRTSRTSPARRTTTLAPRRR